MSSGKNDTFKDLEKNNNGKSTPDNVDQSNSRLRNLDEDLIKILRSTRELRDKYVKPAKSEESEEEVRKKQKSDAAYEAWDFRDFYNSCFREAHQLAEEKPGFDSYTFTGRNCADVINRWLEHENKVDAFIVKEIAPKLHAYIREHGIPAFFPVHSKAYLSLPLTQDGSIPFQGNNVGIFFHYCGPCHPAWVNRNFTHYFYSKADDCNFLKAQLTMPTYEPAWRDDYDEEVSRLNAEADALDKQIRNIEDELARTEEAYKLFRGNLLTDIIGVLLKSIIPLLIAAVCGVATFFACGVFSEVVLNQNFFSLGIIGKIIVSLVVGIVFLPVLAVGLDRVDIFDFTYARSRRKPAREAFENAKQKSKTILPDLKKQREDLLNSDAYAAAQRRNYEAYEADCQLAAEWQRKWYEECRTMDSQYYI